MPRQAPALLLDGRARPTVPARHRASGARKAAPGKQILICRQKMQNRPEKPIASVLCGARCAARTGDEGATACLLSTGDRTQLPPTGLRREAPATAAPPALSHRLQIRRARTRRQRQGAAVPDCSIFAKNPASIDVDHGKLVLLPEAAGSHGPNPATN